MRLLLCLFALSSSLCAAASQPNIIIHFIDDLGYGDIGPFGATKQKTPHLDRMAREGMKLTSFYAAPVCSVSRAQIMTGCYGARVSVPGVYPPGAKNGLHPQEHTIADRLRPLGYATQCIGKWHLGDQPAFLPTKQGFDHYLGIPYSNDMLKTASVDGRRVVPLVRDDKVERLLDEADQDRIEEIYTDEAVKFIRGSKEKPFFLYFPHTAVHTPIHPGKAFQGSSQNGRFGDWVQEVDASVGRVFDTLRELQLDTNTLVIFTSDNGPWLIKGPDGGSAGPLRGGKGTTWEGGVRVPTLAWWPGKIAPGSVCDAVAGTIDVHPTCLKIAGAEVPAQPVLDGRDLSPLLFGQSKDSPREAHYYFSSYNLQAVRQGPWKLALMTQPESMGKDAASDANVNPRLYNLDQEIGERTNLAAQHPDIVAKLTSLAATMTAEIGGNAPKSRRPAGEVENPVTLYPSEDGGRGKKRGEKKQTGASAVSLESLKPGDTLDAEKSPQIAEKPFTLTCELTTAQRDAILIAHGGASTGYALHLSGGKLIWAIRHGKTLTTAQTDYPADNQPHRITATLGQKGQLTLQLDQNALITATSQGLIRSQPKEDFCLGHDNKVLVASYTAKGKFEGRIKQLSIDSGIRN
ncbi:MAG: sulfatase-like hydrolase/transferase [Prosthecobacter sp.]|jgi:arylsulfatase A|uniref:sulfatase-like hydrolase/transferase n=1 Tax=Prosthecobacter sp. TaxID=1965333 RepID=UPI0019EC8ECE|nr:sulfatase-like hydrolase/transferase [Prosthecobacter sp.]MBE2284726.1 sulfatase-like hydrolase/transferase [Prosthecobacter sp.]